MLETVPFGGGSVIVWGICGQQWTDLIVIDRNRSAHCYINQVLRPVLLTFLQLDSCFNRTMPELTQLIVLPWPARSPDLSFVGSSWPANLTMS